MPIFGIRSKVYPFTTENQSGYMHNLNFEGKTVLTIIGSGDHLLNSLFFGAREVVGFDINYLAILFGELKIRAVQRLDFEGFRNFFFICGKKVMDNKIYKQLRGFLSEDCVNFFDNIYKKYKNDGKKIRLSKLFNKRFDIDELRVSSNPYLNSNFSYEKTKINLMEKKIILMNSDVKDLTTKLNCKFDVILLKNLNLLFLRTIDDFPKFGFIVIYMGNRDRQGISSVILLH